MLFTELYVWGNSQFGQLGLGEQYVGQNVNCPKSISYKQIVHKVACGYAHTCLIMSQGFLYAMGSNDYGQLGLNIQSTHVATPQLIEIGAKFSKIKAAANYTVAMRGNELYTWGQNQALNIHTNTPTQMKLKIKSFSCGDQHMGFIDSQGQLLMCGSNEMGQIGLHGLEITKPTKVEQLSKCDKVRCGKAHTLILSEGVIYAFGSNAQGELGCSQSQGGNKIRQLQLQNVRKIYASNFSAAITQNNDLYFWGCGVFGEFRVPTQVQFQGDTKLLSLGDGFGGLLDVNGQVYTWGKNSSGELAQKDFIPRTLIQHVRFLKQKKIHKIYCGSNYIICVSEQQQMAQRYEKLNEDIDLKEENEKLKIQISQLEAALKQEEERKIRQKSEFQLTMQQECRSFDLFSLQEQLEQKNQIIEEQQEIIENQAMTISKLEKEFKYSKENIPQNRQQQYSKLKY